MAQSFKTEAESIEELRSQINHAEELGFRLEDIMTLGEWDDKEGRTIFIDGDSVTWKNVGYEYIEIEITGPDGPTDVKAKPGAASSLKEAGTIRATFQGPDPY